MKTHSFSRFVILAQQSSGVAEEEDVQPSSPSSVTSSESRNDEPGWVTRSQAVPVKKSGNTGHAFDGNESTLGLSKFMLNSGVGDTDSFLYLKELRVIVAF